MEGGSAKTFCSFRKPTFVGIYIYLPKLKYIRRLAPKVLVVLCTVTICRKKQHQGNRAGRPAPFIQNQMAGGGGHQGQKLPGNFKQQLARQKQSMEDKGKHQHMVDAAQIAELQAKLAASG